jgi:hypothetical protein
VTFGSTFFRKYCEPVCGCIHGLASSVLVGGADGDAHTCEGRRAHVVRERTRMPEMSTHASPSHETMQCRNTGEPRRKCTAASLPPAHTHTHARTRTHAHTNTRARACACTRARLCCARTCMHEATDRPPVCVNVRFSKTADSAAITTGHGCEECTIVFAAAPLPRIVIFLQPPRHRVR